MSEQAKVPPAKPCPVQRRLEAAVDEGKRRLIEDVTDWL